MEMKKDKIGIGCICVICCEIIFGLSYIFTKKAIQNSSEFYLLAWRFFVAFLVMNIFVITKVIKIDFKNKNIKTLLVATMFNPIIYFMGETFGVKYTTASESGVFLSGIPIASILMSIIILKKKPNKNQVSGILLTFIGVIITVIAAGIHFNFSAWGYLILLIAVISYALYSVFIEESREYTATEMMYVIITSGFIFYAIIAIIQSLINGSFMELIKMPFNNQIFTNAIIYQGIFCSFLGSFLFNKAILNLGVNKTSSFIGISSVVSILGGVIILNENFTALQFIGVALIIIGIIIANINDTKNKNKNYIKKGEEIKNG